jgi:hypothetical protein
MTTLMRELPPDLYGKLEKAAAQEAKQPAEWTRALLEERLAALPAEEGERARACHALREAGLLVELRPGRQRLIRPAGCHEDVEAALARAGAQPPSEIILEQR